MAVAVSILAEIGDAVVAEIDALDLSTPAATIERATVPSFELSDLNELRVAVVARTDQRQRLTRGGYRQRDVPVEVGVLFRVGDDEDVDAAAILRVVDEIADGLELAAVNGASLRRVPAATLVSLTKTEPAYDVDDFRTRRQITAVVVATYRVIDVIGE